MDQRSSPDEPENLLLLALLLAFVVYVVAPGISVPRGSVSCAMVAC